MNLTKYNTKIKACYIQIGTSVEVIASQANSHELGPGRILKVISKKHCDSECSICNTNRTLLRVWPVNRQLPESTLTYVSCSLILRTLYGQRII